MGQRWHRKKRQHRKMAPKGQLRGSYTVEASLLMGILLAVLVAVIYMGFYLHDRAFLQGAAYEAAVTACLHQDDVEPDASLTVGAKRAQALVKKRMLGTRNATAAETLDEKTVRVTCAGNFRVPGMASKFFGKKKLSVNAGVTLTTMRPSRRIQKIRGVAKVIDSVRRVRD